MASLRWKPNLVQSILLNQQPIVTQIMNNKGIAVIWFDFASTFCWANTNLAFVVNALSIWITDVPVNLFILKQRVFPSMAITEFRIFCNVLTHLPHHKLSHITLQKVLRPKDITYVFPCGNHLIFQNKCQMILLSHFKTHKKIKNSLKYKDDFNIL